MITPEKQALLQKRLQTLGLLETDFKERFILSSGKGGQAQNKRRSSVDLFHVSSGIRVKMQKYRSQELNRYYARKIFCDLYEARLLGKETLVDQKTEKRIKQKQRRKRRSKQKYQTDS
jgi:peptide chain release factor